MIQIRTITKGWYGIARGDGKVYRLLRGDRQSTLDLIPRAIQNPDSDWLNDFQLKVLLKKKLHRFTRDKTTVYPIDLSKIA